MKTSVILPVALTLTALALTLTASACSVRYNSRVTFYGYPDNSPPGPAIAYNCGRGYTAGGTGTYSDPLTVASATGEYNQCEIIYLPYLRKYLRVEDECDECTSDWANGVAHIDVWTGSSTVNGGQTQLNCEDTLTPDANQGIVRQPSSNLPVNGECNFTSPCPTDLGCLIL